MSNDFTALPWHDAGLLELLVDRSQAEERDEIQLRVRWPQEGDAKVLFSGCYGLHAEMNFGVAGEDQIANASLTDDDPGLIALRDLWRPLGVALDLLHCYRIETSSTASVIRIYAKSFEVLPP